MHKNFIQAIAEGRKLSVDKVEKFADGRVLLGSEAKDLGLVDGFGDIYDAAREALVLAKVELKADQIPNLVYANKKKNFLERALDSETLIPSLVEWGSVPTLKYLAN